MIALLGGVNLSYGAFVIRKADPATTEATAKPAATDETAVTTAKPAKATTFKAKELSLLEKR